jgi:hypothetical protein
MFSSVQALFNDWSDAGLGILKVQSELGRPWGAASWQTAAFPPAGRDLAQWLWQFPTQCQLESQRLAHAGRETYKLATGFNDAFLEWRAQAVLRCVEQVADVVRRANRTVASRRISAEVINFSDRRAAIALADSGSTSGSEIEPSQSGERSRRSSVRTGT